MTATKSSAESIFYAGLGALERRSPQEVEELTETGRAVIREAGPDAVSRFARLAEELRKLQREVELAAREALPDEAATRPYDFRVPAVSEVAESAALRPPSDRMPAIIEAMMPLTIPTAPTVLQARRNTAARVALIEEFGLITSADIAEINHSQATNRAALASRWKGEGRIFSVHHQGRDYFPGFQFDPEGKPLAVMTEILAALGGARGWQTALWFTAANGYLDGRRPVDLLEDEPRGVVEAARHEGGEVYF